MSLASLKAIIIYITLFNQMITKTALTIINFKNQMTTTSFVFLVLFSVKIR